MFSFIKPTDATLHRYLSEVREQPYSYEDVGIARDNTENKLASRFTFDHQRGLLGRGEESYHKACAAIDAWRMFPKRWTSIYPPDVAPLEDDVVALSMRTLGLWWRCSCRIVYTFDEVGPTRRYGFAYGTLPDHVEMGEERFAVEWDEDDRVWYDLRAWSRPRHPITWLGYPVARYFQARFRRDSLAAMQEAVR